VCACTCPCITCMHACNMHTASTDIMSRQRTDLCASTCTCITCMHACNMHTASTDIMSRQGTGLCVHARAHASHACMHACRYTRAKTLYLHEKRPEHTHTHTRTHLVQPHLCAQRLLVCVIPGPVHLSHIMQLFLCVYVCVCMHVCTCTPLQSRTPPQSTYTIYNREKKPCPVPFRPSFRTRVGKVAQKSPCLHQMRYVCVCACPLIGVWRETCSDAKERACELSWPPQESEAYIYR